MRAVCSYQGSKQAIAKQIVEIILSTSNFDNDTMFYDACCGSGPISMELVNRGVNPKNITMVDVGPWGIFWKSIGNGSFDLERFRSLCDQIPKNPFDITSYISQMAKELIDDDAVYKFILLQATSFSGKAIWIDGNKWKHHGFRTYWQPTETSSCKSQKVPMTPMPDTLVLRIEEILTKMYGVNGIHSDIAQIDSISEKSIVYIDPPYLHTTGYSFDFNASEYACALKGTCYVSEAIPLTEDVYQIGTNETKGGLSHTRNKTKKTEWLSIFR